MSFLLSASCKTVGAAGTSVIAQSFLFAATVVILPATFYWQYIRRQWWRLGVGLSAFVLMQDWLMWKDKGSLGETFFGATALFGILYLPIVALWEGNRRLARKLAGDAYAEVPLRASECLLLIALSIPMHLLMFVVINVMSVTNVFALDALQAGSDVVNCLFSFAQPVSLQAYRDALNILLAAIPVLLSVTVLASWFRRSRRDHLAMSWHVYFAVTPGVLCGGMLLASLFTR
ncbi:hypothetical protein PQR63_10705 [Herbaspirillum rhizosphaerae]|uniref:Uncharacterized protein n=1 Tax=Herbaspirillum rhizosphaerae TaxID=346179 RepID=A0ABW8Z733_9BURK